MKIRIEKGEISLQLLGAKVEFKTNKKIESSLNNSLNSLTAEKPNQDNNNTRKVSELEYFNLMLTQAKSGLSMLLEQIDNLKNTVNISASQQDGSTALSLINSDFQENISFINKRVEAIRFNGSKIFTGNYAGQSEIVYAYDIQPLKLKSSVYNINVNSQLSFSGSLLGAPQKTSIEILKYIKAYETITLEGVTFTFMKGVAINQYQVSLGYTTEQSAQNLVSVILNADDLVLKKYVVSLVKPNKVLLERISNSAEDIQLTTSSPDIKIENIKGMIGALDLTEVTNAQFIGKISPEFEVGPIVYDEENGQEVIRLTNSWGISPSSIQGELGKNGDKILGFTCTIGNFTYTGLIAIAKDAKIKDMPIFMYSSNEGGKFSINLKADSFQKLHTVKDITSLYEFATKMAQDFNEFFSSSLITQTRYLKLEDGGEGTYNGITAFLEASNFNNPKFKDFSITSGDNQGEASFQASIDDKIYQLKNQKINELVCGKLLLLTSTDGSEEKFGINLGKKSLTKMITKDKMKQEENNFKYIFSLGKSLQINDLLGEMNIESMRVERIFTDDNNTVRKLNIENAQARTIATKVLENATHKIQSQQSKVINALENISNELSMIQKSNFENNTNKIEFYIMPEESTSLVTINVRDKEESLLMGTDGDSLI